MPSLSESFPTIGLLVSGTRKLFSKPKKQPSKSADDLPEDLFADDASTLEIEDMADLEQIAFQAGEDETSPDVEEPEDLGLESPPLNKPRIDSRASSRHH